MVTPVLFQTPVKVDVFKCSNDVWWKISCVDGRFQDSNLDRNHLSSCSTVYLRYWDFSAPLQTFSYVF